MELRKEHKQYKQLQESIIEENAISWLEENIIVLDEQINRDTVQKLTDSITKFDDKFGPYKNKIPSIADHLSQAELELQNVITGKTSDRKASQLLKKLTFLYRYFSNFFARVLSVILKTPILSVPKEFPSMRLDVLQPSEGKAYNALLVRDALKHALSPNRGEMKLLKKIYNGRLPVIQASKIAQEMLALTYHDLESLTQIGKVPMATTMPQEPKQPVATESIQKKNLEFLTEKIDTEKAKKIANQVQQVFSKVNMNIKGLADIKTAFDKLLSQSRKELASGKWDLPGRPTAMKQMVIFYNLLNQYKEQFESVQGLFNKGELTDEDKNDLKGILDQIGKEGIFSKLTSIFKTNPAQGLSAQDLSNAIMNAVNEAGGLESVKQLFTATKTLPQTTPQGEPKSIGTTTPTEKTTPTEPANKTQPTPETTTSGEAQMMGDLDPEKVAKDMVAKLKLPADQVGIYQAFIQNMKKTGYKITQ